MMHEVEVYILVLETALVLCMFPPIITQHVDKQLEKVLIVTSESLLILATAMCMPLNDNIIISNYNILRLHYRTLKYAATSNLICISFAHRNNTHIELLYIAGVLQTLYLKKNTGT